MRFMQQQRALQARRLDPRPLHAMSGTRGPAAQRQAATAPRPAAGIARRPGRLRRPSASAAWRSARARAQGAPRRHPHGGAAAAAEEPRNGYQIMQEVEERSDGVWRPSPGSVYPALQQLEDEGLIRSRGDRRAQAVRSSPTPAASYVERARRGQAGAVGADERRCLRPGARAGQADARGRLRLRAGDATGSEAQMGEARKVLDGDAARPLPDPRRRRRRGRRRATRGRRTTVSRRPRHATVDPRRRPARRGRRRRRRRSTASSSATARSRRCAGIDFEVRAGRDVRLPRPQRRGQVDDDQHALHARAPERRDGARGRPRRRRANATRCGATSASSSRTRRSTAT